MASVAFENVFKGKKVLVTGHTGFKGSWLSIWLNELGAEVSGFSVDLPSQPNHFELTNLKSALRNDLRGDVEKIDQVVDAFKKIQPEIVFHLAAEAIVSRSIKNPVHAFSTNLMGTVNVLEAIRQTESVKVAVMVTSDKCYENVEWEYGYRESDRLGGKDPYSASKACAEIAISTFFRTYLSSRDNFQMASARAGNVIGGGDWAQDRLIPDVIRAATSGKVTSIRNPASTRPWQHVLEPVSGYLALAAGMINGLKNLNGEAFNFGPRSETVLQVDQVLNRVSKKWSLAKWQVQPSELNSKEAGLLKLNCDKALARLQWLPTLNSEEGIDWTTEWYQTWSKDASHSRAKTLSQIKAYESLAAERGIKWAQPLKDFASSNAK